MARKTKQTTRAVAKALKRMTPLSVLVTDDELTAAFAIAEADGVAFRLRRVTGSLTVGTASLVTVGAAGAGAALGSWLLGIPGAIAGGAIGAMIGLNQSGYRIEIRRVGQGVLQLTAGS